MAIADRVIVVIVEVGKQATRLKDMIEFMDSPEVRVTHPHAWQEALGDARAAAVFIAEEIEPQQIEQILQEIGDHDPNVPIVMMSSEGDE